MSSKGRHESPEGEIINLVSVDTQHITVFLSFLPYAWSGPVQLVLSVYFLYRTIGLSAFAGTLPSQLVSFPLSAWSATALTNTGIAVLTHFLPSTHAVFGKSLPLSLPKGCCVMSGLKSNPSGPCRNIAKGSVWAFLVSLFSLSVYYRK